MAWLYLILAGLFEIGWPIGLKLGWTGAGAQPRWILLAIVCMTVSGALLLVAQRTIPIGTAYAVWTGIGAIGTFLVGVYAFGDSANLLRFLGVALIAGGIITLKIA
ncbi:DMT family transporter [Aquamicrobium terrae]|uniref:Guanidinium exporter n=1 Tax=Aquamicrobium terrae TaxID=1324945 RepID=A0ABV2MTC8_9HYPH